MSDRIFAAVWLLVCAVIAVQMWQLEVPFAYEPVGPKAFPALMAFLMAICCALMLIYPDHDINWPDSGGMIKGGILIAVLLFYAIFFEQLGFPLATALMVFVVCLLFGGGWLSGAIAGLLVGVIGYLFFDRLLQVTLPLGQIWR